MKKAYGGLCWACNRIIMLCYRKTTIARNGASRFSWKVHRTCLGELRTRCEHSSSLAKSRKSFIRSFLKTWLWSTQLQSTISRDGAGQKERNEDRSINRLWSINWEYSTSIVCNTMRFRRSFSSTSSAGRNEKTSFLELGRADSRAKFRRDAQDGLE